MTMKALTEPTARAASARQMNAVVFSSLLSGQKAKHENELQKLGFEVDTRDFPRTYNFSAYEVIFIVREHADANDGSQAEKAAIASGKPWFRLTKKTSHATWDSVRAYARKMGLASVPDADSHPPSLATRSFADAFADHMEKKVDGAEWESLAREYEQQALTCAAQTKAAVAKYEAAEAEIKELRKRLADSATDGSSTAAQREAYRRDLALAKGESDRLVKECAALRDANKAIIADREDAIRARSQMKRDYERAVEQRDQQTQTVRRLQDELKTAREELQELRENEDVETEGALADAAFEIEELKKKLHSKDSALHTARRDRDDAKAAVAGLQDEVDRLNRANVALGKHADSKAVPAGKRLVPANIVDTVEKLWSLVGDGVLEADEAMEKILARLKGE